MPKIVITYTGKDWQWFVETVSGASTGFEPTLQGATEVVKAKLYEYP